MTKLRNTEGDRTQLKKIARGILDSTRLVLIAVILCSILTAILVFKAAFFANADNSTFWIVYGTITTAYLITRLPWAYIYDDTHDKFDKTKTQPSVTFIIAAKNEEDGIFETISSCLKSEYSADIELIVIDDGSTDGTLSQIIRAVNHFGHMVRVVSFDRNRGKREAMAAGVKTAKNDIIVFVDSDSFIRKDALRHIVEHFQDQSVGAVSGNTTVHNEKTNMLTKMQSIQYAISFDIYKAGESVHGAVTCCPGCFSAYRKSAILPFLFDWKNHKMFGTKGTFGDDRGLTNFVLKTWNIVYCRNARATTIVPEKFGVYLRQQLRWKKSWIREGLFASYFMWKRNPLASLAFYTNFTFPIMGPVVSFWMLYIFVVYNDVLSLALFFLSFVIIGLMFALYLNLFEGKKYFTHVSIFSVLFVTILIWQMPYAVATITRTHWGTR